MDRSNSQDSFLVDLEKAAKALSVVADRAAIEELRRLFDRLREEHGATVTALEPLGGENAETSEHVLPIADFVRLERSWGVHAWQQPEPGRSPAL